MANRSSDFNYKVALASGLKSLQTGRLRQAEEQFRYLMQHFPTADGGYRGLAKVLVEQEDRAAAMKVLLDGGAKLARAGERAQAIAVYKEAATLEPHDLTAHRRLAAALTLAGSTEDAAHEYVRYIKSSLDTRDTGRAKLEAEFALERLPGNEEIVEAARAAGVDVTEAAARHAPVAATADDERDALMRSAFATASPEPAAPAGRDAQPWQKNATADAWESVPPPASDAWETHAPANDAPSAPPPPSAWDEQPATAEPMPEAEPIAADVDAATVEASAARYLAKGDPRGGQHALEAARRYIAEGRMDAASDLLLQLISSGIAEHDAQRLLVEVAKSLGKKDVAKAKVKLLVEALKLDGRAELAAEVEQLAQAF